MFRYIITEWKQFTTSPLHLLQILLFQFNIMVVAFLVLVALKLYMDMAHIILMFTLFQYEKMYQNKRKYLDPNHPLRTRTITKFMAAHVETLKQIVTVNQLVGRLLLIFFLFNYPLTAYLTLFVLFNPVTIFVVECACIVAFQYQFIVTIHLTAVFFSDRIHGFVASMMHVYIRRFAFLSRVKKPRLFTKTTLAKLGSIVNGKVRRSLVCQWKVSTFIERFNTKKRYGLTYGTIGLISMVSFNRFLFVYLKFLIYYFNLYHKY